ncbi:hypothetical protein [Candidatus Leptofilum sp.]|uniref:SH3 domain-containing protein n=1 Tax=Candidatus Leptofilum sp. TaxID=3241576 RepID=UPI003B590F84
MKKRTLIWGTLFLFLALLCACAPESQELQLATVVPTLSVQSTETAVPTIMTETPKETAVPSTVTPATSPVPTQDAAPPPANQEPTILTQDATNVRQGPGLAYAVSHVLGAGTTMPILGQNLAGDWWAVPGPGDGPGPVGWVFSGVVSVQGNVDSVPVLPALPLADVPIMGNSGQQAADVCTVSHPGPGDLGPLYVYAGPDEHAFAVAARLGLDRWVTVIGRDNDWYHVQDDAEFTAWVPVAHVAHNGLCQPDDGPGSMPLVEFPGSPPTHVCLANRQGQTPPPDIHLGPGRQFALVARLGNWAEVLKTEIGWHQITLGPGEVGWVDGADIELTGPCTDPEPTPVRIQFAPGETSITLDSNLEPPQREYYVFRAQAGQRVILEMVSESNRGNFAVSGMDDGQPYKRLEDEQPSWSIILPATQDYLLTLAAPPHRMENIGRGR